MLAALLCLSPHSRSNAVGRCSILLLFGTHLLSLALRVAGGRSAQIGQELMSGLNHDPHLLVNCVVS